MGQIIDGKNLFGGRINSSKELEDKIKYYRNYLMSNQSIPGYDSYFLITHLPLSEEDIFVNIPCPHCENILNKDTLDGERIIAHGKVNSDDDLDDRSSWGLIEMVCPFCREKSVIIFE